MYKQVIYWVKNYGSAGIPDQKAVHEYIECETTEAIFTLRNELMGISEGKFTEENLDKLVGVKRKLMYNSYSEWAKMMLLWIAQNFRGS